MWEKPFDESMLEYGNIIVHCPEEDSAEELFRLFVQNGLCWNGSRGHHDMCNTYWGKYREDACYRISNQRTITRGSIEFYSGSDYDSCIRCTFYGNQTSTNPINEAAWMSIISI